MDNKILWPGWETVRLIGRGSFGAVYEIERDIFGEKEKAALKVLSIPQSEGDIEEMYSDGYDEESITSTFNSHLKSIVAEYSLMRKMNGSANVVNCDDVRYVQHDDGIGWDIFIKMELLTPLTRALDSKTSEDTVIRVAKDLCHALVLCKKYDIVHRDIKPQNIFVSENGDYKLGDFGIAKTVEKTSGGTKIGTYKYMAPEVYNNQPYGAAADIYSLGLVLYWMLNERRMPFLPLPPQKLTAGMEESARLRRFSGEELPAPANGSEALKAIVLKACAYDPKDRYASADEMLAALTALSGGVVIPQPQIEKPVEEPAFDVIEDNPTEDGTMAALDTDILHEDWTEDGTMAALDVDVPDIDSPKPIEEKKKNKKKKVLSWIVTAAVLTVGLVAAFFPVSTPSDGPSSFNATSTPTDEPLRFDAVSAGGFHTVGLRTDGTVVATEYTNGTYFGQCEVGDWRDIAEVSAGLFHTVGLKEDGTVVATGKNDYGQCNVSEWRDIVAISAAVEGEHTVGLKADGTVVAAGVDFCGECDVSDWRDIVAIGAGCNHTVGLKADGTVVVTGSNSCGQCDVSDWRDIVAISAGKVHTVGLKADGTVVVTGSNCFGQCDVSDWRDIVAISAGDHTVGLKEDGTVVAVGCNHAGQCDVSGWKDFVEISAGVHHTVGLKADGTVVATEFTGNVDLFYSGQCDVSGWNSQKEIAAPTVEEISAVDKAVGYSYPDIAIITPEGTVLYQGPNEYGQGDAEGWSNIVQLSAGNCHIVGLTENGDVVVAGDNTQGQCNISDWSNVVYIDAGEYSTSAITDTGALLTTDEFNERTGKGWTDLVSVAEAYYHRAALRKDGTVSAGGWNDYGQCDVSDWTDIKQIVAGFSFTLGLKDDGTVEFAGAFDFDPSPDFSDWQDIIYIFASNNSIAGLKADGTIVCEGSPDNSFYMEIWEVILSLVGGNSEEFFVTQQLHIRH